MPDRRPGFMRFQHRKGKTWLEERWIRLLANYVSALKEFYPRWFMMENVEGILTTTNGSFIVDCIKGRRKRVIIVGNREGKSFVFPKPLIQASGKLYRIGTEKRGCSLVLHCIQGYQWGISQHHFTRSIKLADKGLYKHHLKRLIVFQKSLMMNVLHL